MVDLLRGAEAAARAAAARHLELPAPVLALAAVAHKRLRVAARHARGLAEVLLREPGLGRAAEQHRALAERRAEGELIEGEALAASLDDARAHRLREAERADRHLRALDLADVVEHRAHDDGDLP